MLRLRKKCQETLVRLKKISKESHEASLGKHRQVGISQKEVLYSKPRDITDFRNN